MATIVFIIYYVDYDYDWIDSTTYTICPPCEVEGCGGSGGSESKSNIVYYRNYDIILMNNSVFSCPDTANCVYKYRD